MDTAVKTKRGLLGNVFRSDKWNSRITTANVTPKEMWLGYVIGPYGMLVVQSIVNSYYNQYMTDVLGFTAERAMWMASFMVLFPLLSKIFDAVTNIVMSKIIDSTVCRQGKVRPWLILSIPLVVLSVVLLFWMPFSGPRAQAAWVCFSYVLYYCVSFTMWNMSKELTPALSTRNVQQRKNLATAAEITRNVGTGIVSILFPMILSGVCAAMTNTFEKVLPPDAATAALCSRLMAQDAMGAMLSGSGSAVFGLFASREGAARGAAALQTEQTVSFFGRVI